MDRVRVGVVGTGFIFYAGHLHAYRNVREAQLVALCDRDESRLRRAEAALKAGFEEQAAQADAAGDPERAEHLRQDAKGIKTYTNTADMFREAGLDLVDIIATPRAHAPVAVEALEAGVNVLCEKPMTRTWLECLPILDAVERSGKLFGCVENMIYESPWYDVKRQVDSGVIGDPLVVFISFGLHEALPVRLDPAASGGGALVDMGIHALVTAWFMCGFHHAPVRAGATAPVGIATRMPERLIQGKFERIQVEDDAHVLFEFEDEARGSRVAVHVEASFSGQDCPGNRIIGSHGTLQIGSPVKVTDTFGNTHEVRTQQPRSGYGIVEAPEDAYSGFVGMVHEMCRCVQDGTKPIYDAQRGADAMALIGAAYLSELRGGKGVTLDEFKEHMLKLREQEGDRASDVFIEQVCEHLVAQAGRSGSGMSSHV